MQNSPDSAVVDTGNATTPSIESSSLDFCLRLTRAYAVVTRRLDTALSSVHGLSFSDFMVLYYLDRAPESRLRRIDLAERLGVTASGVTRTLLPLEKLGWVSRLQDPRDARVGFAVITDAGKELLSYALTSIAPLAKEATQAVPEDHRPLFSTVLGQLAGMHLANS